MALDIRSLEQISTFILPRFDAYPLISNKKADYDLFKRIIAIMKSKEHLTDIGLQEIVNIRATLNRGLSPELTTAFPNTKSVARPLVVNQKIPSPFWMAGFTSGEGSFQTVVYAYPLRGSQNNIETVRIIFTVSQHIRDEALLKSFVPYFGCGRYYVGKDLKVGGYMCSVFSDIYDKIIPFFIKHRIVGVKSLDFIDWCKVADIIKAKNHLTLSGLNQEKRGGEA